MVRLALLSSQEPGLGTVSDGCWRGGVPLFLVLGIRLESALPLSYTHSPTHTLLLSWALSLFQLVPSSKPTVCYPPPGLQMEEVEGIPGPIPSLPQRGVPGYSGSLTLAT